MDNAKYFRTGFYGVKELALCYFPNSVPASASIQLKRWIRNNTNLSLELENAGYTSGQKLLTPLQVKIIVQYLGEP